MNQLPPPPTPADADLREFAFMPLDVLRLRDSEVAARSSGDEFRCAVLLWCAAWHQVPAGSLPDDDIVLSQLAGFGRAVKEWQKVREGSMRNWYKCQDGRLYHPVVAEKAAEAWAGRVKYAERKEAERVRKAEERRLKKEAEEAALRRNSPPDNPDMSAGQTGNVQQTSHGNPPENALKETVDSGQWTVDSGQLTSKADISSPQPPTPDAPEAPNDLVEKMPRKVQITLLLRAQGITTTADNPIVAVTFAQDQRVTDDLLNVAILKSKEAKPGQKIPLAYLLRVVESELKALAAPASKIAEPQKGDPGHWQQSAKAIEAKGKSLGMQQGATELLRDYAIRIQAEQTRRKGQP